MNWRLLVGDVREKLAELPDASVQCVVTSPPYWGLRDYGTATWKSGDPTCKHRSPTMREGRNEDRAKLGGSEATNSAQLLLAARSACGKCGAIRTDSQIGLEPTPEAYVAALVLVFADVWRVLRDDGTLWLNLGDCYSAGKARLSHELTDKSNPMNWANRQSYRRDMRPREDDPHKSVGGLEPKNLVGIPWRVAFALQVAGWYLRSDIIWSKPNPMPESVTDRPTKAHEYLFLLTKSARYYYDADAIAEPASLAMQQQIEQGYDGLGLKDYDGAGVQNPSTVKARIIANARRKNSAGLPVKGEMSPRNDGNDWNSNKGRGFPFDGVTRNARSVWTIPTQPYPGAHFATFPESIPERCIKAGSRLGDTVLDNFCGSGTTGEVAIRLGRSFIGIELNEQYAELARTRIGGAAPLFAEATA